MGWNKHKTCQATGSMETEKMQAGGMPSIGRVQFVQKKMNKLCSEKREQNRTTRDYSTGIRQSTLSTTPPLIACHPLPHDPTPTHATLIANR